MKNASSEEGRPDELPFLRQIRVMIWTVLNPGPDTDAIPDEGLFGFVANHLFAVYQIIVVIILLNLLIAMMNSTTQKIADKKLLYWKFVRTRVWLDFISTRHIIPPPTDLLFIAFFGPIHSICYTI
jgi:hypothetical protein